MSRRSLNDYQLTHPLSAKIERLLHRYMDRICGNSSAVVRQLAEEGVSGEQLRLIYNGIDLTPFSNSFDRVTHRSAENIAPDTLVFAMVANLIPYKGHADLLEALALIGSELPEDWLLLCIGRDDGIGEALQTRAAALGIAKNIRWLGSRADVPDLLCLSDLGLLCSHQEGFSNAILECMAAGLPVIATDVGGNAEAVLDGVTGYVVPAGQPGKLAIAIKRAVMNPYRKEMGLTARERVEKHFSLAACISGYESLYTEVSS